MGALVLPNVPGRRALLDGGRVVGEPEDSTVRMAATGAPFDDALEDVPPAAYDRVVRVVSWTFVLATSTIVAVTGLWHDTQPAIFILLALTGLFILVVHEMLPPETLGNAKFVVEGSAAITVVTLLVLLTGQAESPFFFAYPLIVVGAALVVSPLITLALAGVASLGYVLASLLPIGSPPIGLPAAVLVGINLTSLILLAYVAMVIAREQRRARDAAIRLSTVDSLTGLFNRAFFFAALEREIVRCSRSGRGFCLLMMDLDELKMINDRFGHFHGDRMLRGVGAVIRSGVRRIDTPARYGGDEFVVLCPETDPTGAFVLAEKIRQEVAAIELRDEGDQIHASMSVGVVAFPEDGRTADQLMITADQAMYTSKRFGKNRVTGAPSGPSRPAVTTIGGDGLGGQPESPRRATRRRARTEPEAPASQSAEDVASGR